MKSQYKRYTHVGPGGTKCSCCFPQNTSKYASEARRQLRRQAIKREVATFKRNLFSFL